MRVPDWITKLAIEHPCLIVGEVKTCSPYGFSVNLSLQEALAHVEPLSDVISIHTDPLWGGSYEWLGVARGITKKPILAKGFHNTKADVERCFDLGADYVLTVGWYYPDIRCWQECSTIDEVDRSGASCVVWNARNPRTGEKNPVSINSARRYRRGMLCQASCIRKRGDIGDGVNAVLIGEAFYQK